jgi:hypothetical protein
MNDDATQEKQFTINRRRGETSLVAYGPLSAILMEDER